MQDRTDWPARRAEVMAADGDEWDRLATAFDEDWKTAYCEAFRRVARERGWKPDDIESGWLDDLPGEALIADSTRDPGEVAAEDVIECEIAADA